jgi:sec-independent protein translocase protein TatB
MKRERNSVFGISGWELGLIVLVALILLGPRQLAETAKVLGKVYREIQKMALDVRSSIDLDSLTSEKPRREFEETKQHVSRAMSPDTDLTPLPGQKSGPDFYAELLEQSKEEETKEDSPSSGEPSKKEAGTESESESEKDAEKETDKGLSNTGNTNIKRASARPPRMNPR